ncbi:NotI family restriction endonuclease [Saccharopolyspora sp. NFXS83]|uniref:NotI family restriction endonuclease n=1 Tax=Saccharopolyspora sp. NFXS83 TaxID=2993560 RepID=UPI00224B890C|nr:NotI family restriction endonuclease [Saccharopolyspora sp. NFXS83]MCX2734462.1 NotI family restriction endonuclease [Saccharopolyspora sp. NFXS83]
MAESDRVRRGSQFPIVEAYGYAFDSTSDEAKEAWSTEWCHFMERACEKKRQYKFGYCSITYAASWDDGVPKTYSVCDHRLDGDPIKRAVSDHFGSRDVTLVPEVTATSKPRLNIDYVAFADDKKADGGVDIIAIEAQAIDLRGGGVGPAWKAWEHGDASNWRKYFTAEAKEKGRKKDTVDYGINTGNVYKRLGTQVAEKGQYFKEIKIPLYVVMQHSILRQLRSRIDFPVVAASEDWDITFMSFDYTGATKDTGELEFKYVETVRTTLDGYIEAMHTSGAALHVPRKDFIAKAKKKAKPQSAQLDLLQDEDSPLE